MPIPPKRLDKLPDYLREQQEINALQVFHEVVSHILSSLTDFRTRYKHKQGIEVKCCNEKVRRFIPKLVCWLANHMENCTLHVITTNQCPFYTAPPYAFGELYEDPLPSRAHAEYVRAFQASDIVSLR